MELKLLSESVINRWTTKEVHDADFNGFCLSKKRIKTILDVGANLGQSIVSLRILFPDADIHSFEANPTLIGELNKLSNQLPGNIKIHPYGLGDKPGSFYLNIPYAGDEVFLEEASISEAYYELPWVKQKFIERGGLTKLEKVQCELKTGDDLNLAPDLIKVDVEGAESLVLAGLRNTIQKFKPVIMIENSDWDAVAKVMKSLNYVARQFDQSQNMLVPQKEPTTNTFYIYQAPSLIDSVRGLITGTTAKASL